MGNYSPLRYPGGKSALYPAISGIIKSNKMDHCIYVDLQILTSRPLIIRTDIATNIKEERQLLSHSHFLASSLFLILSVRGSN